MSGCGCLCFLGSVSLGLFHASHYLKHPRGFASFFFLLSALQWLTCGFQTVGNFKLPQNFFYKVTESSYLRCRGHLTGQPNSQHKCELVRRILFLSLPVWKRSKRESPVHSPPVEWCCRGNREIGSRHQPFKKMLRSSPLCCINLPFSMQDITKICVS